LGLLIMLGNHIGAVRQGSFGAAPSIGAAVGALLVLIGAMRRADVVGLAGTIVFAIAAGTELVGLGRMGGTVLSAELGICAALALVALGLTLRRRMQ
jgi:hypothetical protein